MAILILTVLSQQGLDNQFLFHQIFEYLYINPFHTTGLFLCPLKITKNYKFSDVFRRYRNRPVAWNGLIIHLKPMLLIHKKFKDDLLWRDPAKVLWKSQKGHNTIEHMQLVLQSKFVAWNQLQSVKNSCKPKWYFADSRISWE